ncbi:MAG TPA: tail fiber domain-containing protein [Xanthobacteraceae bacterium]|jgi:hypothetical protein|nr:tail fiber domain-containing protein [Xanthobacteraceae bacterium]
MIAISARALCTGISACLCLLSAQAFSQSVVDQRWPATTDSSDWALAYAKPAQTPDPFSGLAFKPPATGLPAESGVNYSLSPFAGYLNLGSGSGGQSIGGTSGSIAFPLGQSFGLLTQGSVGSIGGNGFYQGGANLYWRDPSVGLIGATGQAGHYGSFGGANFASGGANFESYSGRFTPFATVGAFHVQTLSTKGFGTIGTAYYPIDNLQLKLSGYDFGGISGVRGGVEYLLPQRINGVATTIGANGFVGNHGMSGAMGRISFLFGPTPSNNKTLVERRRQDDPLSDAEEEDAENFLGFLAMAGLTRTEDLPSGGACSDGESPSQAHCTCPPGDVFGTPPLDECSYPSDVRLKRDIVKLGRLANGLGLYRYRYLDSDQVYVGVMAQEVALIVPEAVKHMPDGYHWRVDYPRLGMKLMAWEEWMAENPDAQQGSRVGNVVVGACYAPGTPMPMPISEMAARLAARSPTKPKISSGGIAAASEYCSHAI